ncbi:hypothetical protein C8R43DRAFT_440321 [Mycena crocata]|nr:hypothetical protein C8R43DRAFT_440321 [Mycena crocata]
MPLLGGLFTRGSASSNNASKSKNSLDPSSQAYSSSQTVQSQPTGSSSHPSSSQQSSSQASPTAEYVSFIPGPGPSSPNGRGLAYAGEPQKDRRGLGFFGRKRSTNAMSNNNAYDNGNGPGGMLDVFANDSRGPRPSYLSRLSTSSDVPPSSGSATSPRSLRPPPQGMFSTSTRSLPPPQPSHSMSHSSSGLSSQQQYTSSLSPLSPSISPTKSTASGWTTRSGATTKTSKSTGAKAGRKFAFWARSSKSPSPVPPSPTSRDYDDSRGGEFNLRAFRHVQAEPSSSPAPSNGKGKNGGKNGNKGKNAPLTATNLSSLGREYDSGGEMQRPPPRPRGTSDASSRISVAAFREVHARRSLAGSPAPGDGPGPARAPSPGPGMYNLNNGSGRQHVPQSPGPPPPSKSNNDIKKKKESGHQRMNNQWESESDEEEEDEESESDSGGGRGGAGTTRRKRTVRTAAKSEAGHGAGGHGGAKQSTLGVYGMMGPSVSAGNVNVGVTSKRLSQGTLPPIQQKQTSQPQPRPQRAQMPPQQQQKPRQHSTSASSSDSGSEDSDDAPLATLVAPRRPGSSLSLASNSSRGNGSNVNLAMGSHPNLHSNSNLVPHSPLAPHNTGGSSNASKGQPNKPKPLIDIAALTASRPAVFSQKERDGDGFTGTGMLAGGASRGAGGTASPSTSAAASPVLTSRSPPVTNTGLVHFPSPPGSPVAETPPRVAGLGRVLGGALTGAGVSSRALKDEPPKRSSPMRRETASSAASLGATTTTTSTSPSTSPAVSPVSAPKRDVLSERLRAVAAANSEKERQERLQRSPPPSFSSVTARKAFHRRSSSDIVSATARTWGAEDDKDKDGDADLGRDLAEMLGGGISLLSRAGEMSPPRISSTDAVAALGGDWEKKEAEAEEEGEKDKDSIAPIVIKQRSPPPAFSVTSRPSHQAHQQTRSVSAYGDLGIRQRSSTMVPVSTPSTFGGSNRSATSNSNSNSNSNSTSHANSTAGSAATLSTSGSVANDTRSSTGTGTGLRARQRSSTMMPLGSGSVVSTPSPPATVSPPSMLNNPPTRPFAAPRMERNSPASSTGDSSSGPVPLTPRDGSDFGSGGSGSVKEEREGWSGGVSGLVPVGASGRKMHHQRRSVSFDFEEEVSGDGKGKANAKAKPRETPVQEEERRRERRRSEARAAIELGNVINGRGPIADEDEDEDDDDVPINQTRMNTMGNMGMSTMGSPMGMGMSPMNNMMGMNMPMGFNNSPPTMSPGWPAWQQQQQGSPGMLSPAQFMVPPPADPNFYAAHQQAMMIAKQAYQMAVAQQAMAAAGDEWERGSSVGGFAGRGSVYGGSTVGGPAPSVMGSSYGMGMGMQNSGMGGWSSPGGGMFPPAPRSMYGGGGGGARSEYGGGGGGGGGWNSSRSVYGETFGPSTERYSRTVSSGNLAAPAKQTTRESGYFPPVPAVPQGQSGRPGPGNPRQRTASQPASPSRGAVARRTPPPSSWKAS